MSLDEVNILYQQMGEVLSKLRGLNELISLTDKNSQGNLATLRGDLSAIRDEHRALEGRVDVVVHKMHENLHRLEGGAANLERSMSDMVDAVKRLEIPVAELVALRAKLGGFVVGAGMLGSAGLWIVEPMYRWAVEQLAPKH